MSAFTVVTMHDAKYQPLADLTSKKGYCDKNGYNLYIDDGTDMPQLKFQAGNPPLKSGYMPIGYAKFFTIKNALKKFPETQWLFFTECDVMITNFSVLLENIVHGADDIHFMISADLNGLNTGNFLVRNSEIGIGFMNNILSSLPLYKHYYLFENQYIQDCLVGTHLTEQGVKNGGSLWNSVTRILPQRSLNSYDYCRHPKLKNRNPVDIFGHNGQWMPGDFLVHWPAMTLEERISEATLYLEKYVKM